jgi:hypothetical protein
MLRSEYTPEIGRVPSFRRLAVLLLIVASAGCSSRRSATTAPSDAPAPPGPLPASTGVFLDEDLTARQVFPVSNWWNLDISTAPVDPSSKALIDWISGRTPQDSTPTARLHPDFGPPPYGIPYVTVPSTQTLLPVVFSPYGSQSDAGAPGFPPGYPIPDEARLQPNYIEGGTAGGGNNGDRHLIEIDRDHWLLYETWSTHWNSSTSKWNAGSGATFDLGNNERRPDTWTSADAAGLAIFPGLIRYDGAVGAAEIHHAFRFTTRATNGKVWPASHVAGSTVGAPPMGARLRMKASVNLSGYTPELQRIFRAMKRYGIILADNGTDMYMSGTMDVHWDNDVLNPAFHRLHADDFEVIQLGWNPVTAGVP